MVGDHAPAVNGTSLWIKSEMWKSSAANHSTVCADVTATLAARALRIEIHGFAPPPSTAMRDPTKRAETQITTSLGIGGMIVPAKSEPKNILVTEESAAHTATRGMRYSVFSIG
jgi:hypothetical protein